MKKTGVHLFILFSMGLLAANYVPAQESIRTRIGELSFTHDFANGYPTTSTQKLLFDEMDFQRACQAYLWSIPIVSMAQWKHAFQEQLGAKDGQIVYQESYEDKLGGLTYNATTPCALVFIDLSNGPWVIVIPKGEIRGAANDFWQIGIAQMTKPGKYLLVGPGQDIPKDAKREGFEVVEMTTMNVMPGLRLMPKDPDERLAILKKIEIYPYAERTNPKPRGYITPGGKPWLAAHPRGLAYWERLADIINREPVHERDRYFMAMLKPLGIEKGKQFKPNSRQKKILEEATLVGEAMAKANDFFNPRIEDSHYVKGSNWEYATVCTPNQRRKYYDDLDERAAWFYEAVTNDPMMHGQESGKGQVYLAAYKDKNGDWLDGGVNYILRVPPNAPAEAFWSITVYDVDTRCLIKNKQEIADRSSRMDLIKNKDGSVDIYIGPDAPKGKEKNWIPTVKGKAWFPYFRLYSPKKAFLDKSWVLPDIEKVK
jgi:hypothetical protein